eukprot:tig00021621_g22978.t1
MEPAAKRSRLAVDDPEDAGSDARRSEASIGDLSDELLALVFSFLPLEKAWPLRRVCKAWREIIQVPLFRRLGVSTSKPAHLLQLHAALLGSSSVRLDHVSLSLRADGLSQADAFGLWGGALGVLSAIASQHAGRGPKTVLVDYRFLKSLSDDVVPVESFVSAALLALRPPRADGAAKPAALQRLQLRVSIETKKQQTSADALRSALAPFSNLRSLELPKGWLSFKGAEAGVLAECCPRLRCLTMTPREADAVARLAPLPLERLDISGSDEADVGGSLAALAAGAAGRTLKRLRSNDNPWSRHHFNGDDLRAIALFPELETLKKIHVSDDVSREDVAALGAAPKLRELTLLFESEGEAGFFLYGLADAVRASRSLDELNLVNKAPEGTDAAALTECLTAAADVLEYIWLHVERPLTAGEVAALAACARSRDIYGEIKSHLDSSADLLALEGLRGAVDDDLLKVTVATDDPLLHKAAEGVLRSWAEFVHVQYPKSESEDDSDD